MKQQKKAGQRPTTHKDAYAADMRLSFYRLTRALGMPSLREPRDPRFANLMEAMSKRLTVVELDDARIAFDALLRESPVIAKAKGDA